MDGWTRASRERTSRGTNTLNEDPLPGADLTLIVPPIESTSFFVIASPRPVPPYLRVVELSAWVNASNSLSVAWGAIPIPVSWTSI